MKEQREKAYTDYITFLNGFDNSIWKPVKYAGKPKWHIPPIREVTNTSHKWARRDEEKTQTLAKHLVQVFTPNTNVRVDDVEVQLSNVPNIIP